MQQLNAADSCSVSSEWSYIFELSYLLVGVMSTRSNLVQQRLIFQLSVLPCSAVFRAIAPGSSYLNQSQLIHILRPAIHAVGLIKFLFDPKKGFFLSLEICYTLNE